MNKGHHSALLKNRLRFRLTPWQVIALGYVVVILLGAFLLSTPIASKSRTWTNAINSIFTSTAATCVTGLSVFDTASHFSLFGQIIILILIQIGGMGFMTTFSMLHLVFRRKIGAYEQNILLHSTSSDGRFSGAIQLIKHIVIGTILFESLGTILLMITFCSEFGFWKGLYYAIFLSISSFCNAGVDILGKGGINNSLGNYSNNALVLLPIALLITVGSIGFIVWQDLVSTKFRLKKLTLHTKIVLVSTAVLYTIPTLLFYLFEFKNAYIGMSGGEQFLSSLFLAISPRSAGFLTIPLDNLSNSSHALLLMLMLIGGNSGSTAGGIKTTTLVVLIAALVSTVRKRQDITIVKRRIEPSLLKTSVAILSFYLMAISFSLIIISAIEPSQSFIHLLFEVTSAITTVGMTFGITPQLSIISKLFLISLMYVGRIGLITIVLAIGGNLSSPQLKRPIEKIAVG